MDVNKLPVYNTVRLLFEQFERSTKKLPINIKRGAASEIEHWMIEVMEKISFANLSTENNGERLRFIQEASDVMKKIMIRVRVLHSLKMIPNTGFSAIINYEENASRQLAGWARKTYKELVK